MKLTEEQLWEIEDELMGVEKGGGGGGGDRQGKKTKRAIKEEVVKNYREKEMNLITSSLKNDLEKSPIKNLNESQIPGALEYYSLWLIKCLDNTDTENLHKQWETEIEYSQTRSSGPGGQNVNKTSTAVIARHILTGFSSRSESSREMLDNKDNSRNKLISNLDRHIENWKKYLNDFSKDSRQSEIEDFVKSAIAS